MEFEKDYIHELTEKIIKTQSKKLDDVFVKALSVKGYSFKDKEDLFEFIKKNCRAEDHPRHTVYFVLDKPFLKHFKGGELSSGYEDREFKMSVDLGRFELI